jgi:hypothetical protein
MIRLPFLCLLILCFSCGDTTKQNHSVDENKNEIAINANSPVGIHEKRLGESHYFIQLPDIFNISETRGKEGQLGYNVIHKDTSSTMFGFIEIKHGNPIEDNSLYDGEPNEIISSYLLDKKVEWKIYKTETGFFDARTNEKGDLNANASSKDRNEIDSLVSIISTLRQK